LVGAITLIPKYTIYTHKACLTAGVPVNASNKTLITLIHPGLQRGCAPGQISSESDCNNRNILSCNNWKGNSENGTNNLSFFIAPLLLTDP
jgi:hypothetical protein